MLASFTAARRKRAGLNGFIVDPHLIVQVRPGGATRRADAAEHCAGLDRLTLTHCDPGEMAVARGDSIAVIDLDHVAVTPRSFGSNHTAGGRGADGRAIIVAKVDAGVHRRAAEKWIDPNAPQPIGRQHRFLHL